jgi:methionyl-tRNA synthetase
MKHPFYVTTPIYYVNAEPHIGHTYTTVVADTLARYHRLTGEKTFFLTGTDEHGEKIAEVAAQRGVSPAEIADQYSGAFRETWEQLGFSYDRFIRTTDPDHVAVVQDILQKVHDAGDIYFQEYDGLYCVGCERFLTERDMEGGLCRDHERAPEKRHEANYFFRMSKYFAWLADHIESHPDFIRPERYKNEALAMLRDESGLGDLCISRPKERLSWGIELPFDRDYVCYVWFDALINYLTGAGYPDGAEFEERWGAVEHCVAKDILKPHAIFWPTMLPARCRRPSAT